MATIRARLSAIAISMRSPKCMQHSARKTCSTVCGGDVVSYSRLIRRCRSSKMECGIKRCRCMKMRKYELVPVLCHILSLSIICGRIIGFDVLKNFNSGSCCRISQTKKTIPISFSNALGESRTGQRIETCWKITSTVSWNSPPHVVKFSLPTSRYKSKARNSRSWLRKEHSYHSRNGTVYPLSSPKPILHCSVFSSNMSSSGKHERSSLVYNPPQLKTWTQNRRNSKRYFKPGESDYQTYGRISTCGAIWCHGDNWSLRRSIEPICRSYGSCQVTLQAQTVKHRRLHIADTTKQPGSSTDSLTLPENTNYQKFASASSPRSTLFQTSRSKKRSSNFASKPNVTTTTTPNYTLVSRLSAIRT